MGFRRDVSVFLLSILFGASLRADPIASSASARESLRAQLASGDVLQAYRALTALSDGLEFRSRPQTKFFVRPVSKKGAAMSTRTKPGVAWPVATRLNLDAALTSGENMQRLELACTFDGNPLIRFWSIFTLLAAGDSKAFDHLLQSLEDLLMYENWVMSFFSRFDKSQVDTSRAEILEWIVKNSVFLLDDYQLAQMVNIISVSDWVFDQRGIELQLNLIADLGYAPGACEQSSDTEID